MVASCNANLSAETQSRRGIAEPKQYVLRVSSASQRLCDNLRSRWHDSRSCYRGHRAPTRRIPVDARMGALDAAAIPAVGYAVRRAQAGFDESRVPFFGVMGAFVFAAQMINFPVGIGTTGHLVGGALLAFTLGPAAASVVMSAILAIQALVFQDGGILALGSNIANMAIFGVLAGYLPFLWGQAAQLAIFSGGFLSVW